MSGEKGSLRRILFIFVGGGISVSLLFWAKLRLVTQIPRTTYAAPELQGDPPRQGADQDEAKQAERTHAEPPQR